MSVSIRPGNTDVTRSAVSSPRRASASARSPNLLAAYAPQPGLARIPAPEFMNTT
ncbi:Uncharacterised protein [Mycobacteroides abscessus subsp. abscessus]|nr:Uncharacterised protein [Mycobacteroides abscessus subsp. abscessus]